MSTGTPTTGYSLTTTVAGPYEQALERARTALREQGFGVLTEIDVRATLREKLGVGTGVAPLPCGDPSPQQPPLRPPAYANARPAFAFDAWSYRRLTLAGLGPWHTMARCYLKLKSVAGRCKGQQQVARRVDQPLLATTLSRTLRPVA